MATIRRSGGFVAFFWTGTLPAPEGGDFALALQRRRFRTIENAASEEVSVGWVTPADPTGDSFTTEDMDGGTGTWLRFRVDRKVLPKKWLQIHRDAAEKAKGKKLSARERRELKDDLMDKLLPRVLPTIQLVDALLFAEKQTVLLFANGKGAREAFGKLFFESFSLPLERGDPLQCGRRADIGKNNQALLERIEPVRWPRPAGDDRPEPSRRAVRAADPVGEEGDA